jgi:hypothetical protein
LEVSCVAESGKKTVVSGYPGATPSRGEEARFLAYAKVPKPNTSDRNLFSPHGGREGEAGVPTKWVVA